MTSRFRKFVTAPLVLAVSLSGVGYAYVSAQTNTSTTRAKQDLWKAKKALFEKRLFAYYDVIERRDFAQAWDFLDETLRAKHGTREALAAEMARLFVSYKGDRLSTSIDPTGSTKVDESVSEPIVRAQTAILMQGPGGDKAIPLNHVTYWRWHPSKQSSTEGEFFLAGEDFASKPGETAAK